MKIKIALIFFILFFSAGCTGAIKEQSIYIQEVSTEPLNIDPGESFKLYTTINNPTQLDDQLYISYNFDTKCISFKSYSKNRETKYSVGEIESGSQRKVSEEFTAASESEGQACALVVSIYPTEKTDVYFDQVTKQILISTTGSAT